MIILLKNQADQKQVNNLTSWLKSMGFDIHMSQGQTQRNPISRRWSIPRTL